MEHKENFEDLKINYKDFSISDYIFLTIAGFIIVLTYIIFDGENINFFENYWAWIPLKIIIYAISFFLIGSIFYAVIFFILKSVKLSRVTFYLSILFFLVIIFSFYSDFRKTKNELAEIHKLIRDKGSKELELEARTIADELYSWGYYRK